MWNSIRAALGKKPSGGVSASDMWMIVGLGNPDHEHENNRHNIGFMTLDRMAYDVSLGDWRARFQGMSNEMRFGPHRALLLKPQNYMNLSGRSVREAATFFKIDLSKIIVLHDELDLPLGKVRVKFGGGAAGHNGLKSIDADLGSQDYWRVRIGIGHPGDKARVSGYVLSDFSKDERHQMDILTAVISRHFRLLLDGQDAAFMTSISNDTKD